MHTYSLRLDGREEGPFSEGQVFQLFADGRAARETPCRIAPDGPWRTIDDLLPMIKYGTQLPPPTSPVVRSEEPAVYRMDGDVPPALPQWEPWASRVQVSVVDFDLPFLSILKLMFKWAAAAFLVFCCFIPAFVILLFLLMALFGSLLGGIFSGFHQP